MDDEDCIGTWNLPTGEAITLQGGHPNRGQVLDGDDEAGPILRGHDVGQTVIRNLTIQNGDTQDDGAGIYLTGDSTPTIEANNFFNNDANRGGAVAIGVFGSPPVENGVRGNGEAPVVLRDNLFGGDEEGNSADARGGAVYMNTGAPVHMFSNDFLNNDTFDGSGGAAYIILIGGLILDDNVFEENTAQKRGGGMTARMCAGADPASVTNNLFDDNIIEPPEFILLRARVETRDGPLGAGLHLTDECQFGRAARGANGPEFDVVQSGNDFIGNTIDERVDQRPPGGGAGEAIQGLATQSTSDYYFDNEVHRTNGEGGGLKTWQTLGF